MFDVDDIDDNVYRLYRSQSFHDPDYPSCVHNLFQEIAKRDENLAIEFVRYVISHEFDLKNEEITSRGPELLKALNPIGEEADRLVVEDGSVEIENAKSRNAIALGIASDEVKRCGLNPRKGRRLIDAGADNNP
ncbi:hypothetical protein CW706_05560 [Candidatus Bathyarchaeota archaeon]|nr:MAG: hypothetical protein CW706_05560 [Candidatus Bathyarchaeota archaeon]